MPVQLRGHTATTPTSWAAAVELGYARLTALIRSRWDGGSLNKLSRFIADDIFDIAPLELDTANAASAQLFKIRKPDTSEWYYLSYRQALGFDQSLHNSYLGGLAYINMQATDQPVKQS